MDATAGINAYIVKCRCPSLTRPGHAPGPGVVRILDDGRNAYFAEIRDARLGPAWACWGCGRYFRVALVVGKLGRQACGSKCMGSTGPACECKCRGANHGASHAA